MKEAKAPVKTPAEQTWACNPTSEDQSEPLVSYWTPIVQYNLGDPDPQPPRRSSSVSPRHILTVQNKSGVHQTTLGYYNLANYFYQGKSQQPDR